MSWQHFNKSIYVWWADITAKLQRTLGGEMLYDDIF